MSPMDAYIKGLRDAAKFCVAIVRTPGIRKDQIIDLIKKNIEGVIKEHNLDHSRSDELGQDG